jgi:single-strand DNA-binding protein
MRRTNSGKAVVSFTLACDKGGKNTGASFIDCVAWEKNGEFISNYFKKGAAIIVEGRLETRQYETKDGHKRTATEVVVTQSHFCEKKSTSDQLGEAMTPQKPLQEFAVLDGDCDDLPFTLPF